MDRDRERRRDAIVNRANQPNDDDVAQEAEGLSCRLTTADGEEPTVGCPAAGYRFAVRAELVVFARRLRHSELAD